VGVFAALSAQADEAEQFIDARPAGGGVFPAQAEGDVFRHREVGEQGVVLEHHADAAALRGLGVGDAADDAAVEADFAGTQTFEAGDAPQHRGLAAARGAEQAADAAAVELQRELADHQVIAEGEVDVVELEV